MDEASDCLYRVYCLCQHYRTYHFNLHLNLSDYEKEYGNR
jgi:hypothetical protein